MSWGESSFGQNAHVFQLSCLQHKLWCRYTKKKYNRKTWYLRSRIPNIWLWPTERLPFVQVHYFRGRSKPIKEPRPVVSLCWLDLWQSGFNSQLRSCQEKLRMAQEQMRRAETKCPILCFDLRKSTTKKSIITMMIIISCAFFKTIL